MNPLERQLSLELIFKSLKQSFGFKLDQIIEFHYMAGFLFVKITDPLNGSESYRYLVERNVLGHVRLTLFHRKGMNPKDLKLLVDRLIGCGVSQRDISRRIGIPLATVHKLLRAE